MPRFMFCSQFERLNPLSLVLHSITKTNELFYAGVLVVIKRLGVKIDKVAGRKEPMWKRRLQNKIKELRKDLSQLEASEDKDIRKKI